MFPYELYKFLHLFCIIFFAGLIGLTFAPPSPPKWAKILSGTISVLIFVAGMGLLARLGIGHSGDPWPKWIVAKMILWLALAVLTPILGKRLQGVAKTRAFLGLMAIFGILVWLGVYRPF